MTRSADDAIDLHLMGKELSWSPYWFVSIRGECSQRQMRVDSDRAERWRLNGGTTNEEARGGRPLQQIYI